MHQTTYCEMNSGRISWQNEIKERFRQRHTEAVSAWRIPAARNGKNRGQNSDLEGVFLYTYQFWSDGILCNSSHGWYQMVLTPIQAYIFCYSYSGLFRRSRLERVGIVILIHHQKSYVSHARGHGGRGPVSSSVQNMALVKTRKKENSKKTGSRTEGRKRFPQHGSHPVMATVTSFSLVWQNHSSRKPTKALPQNAYLPQDEDDDKEDEDARHRGQDDDPPGDGRGFVQGLRRRHVRRDVQVAYLGSSVGWSRWKLKLIIMGSIGTVIIITIFLSIVAPSALLSHVVKYS